MAEAILAMSLLQATPAEHVKPVQPENHTFNLGLWNEYTAGANAKAFTVTL